MRKIIKKIQKQKHSKKKKKKRKKKTHTQKRERDGRGREGGRERQRQRQTETHRETERQRQRDRETDRLRHRQTDRQTDRQRQRLNLVADAGPHFKRTRKSHSQPDERWDCFTGSIGETSERRVGAHTGFPELLKFCHDLKFLALPFFLLF